MTTPDRDLLRQCAASGQMDASQIAAHQRAGELDPVAARTRRVQEHELRWRPNLTEQDVGYESAMPVTFAGREPTDWTAVALWAAVALCFTAVVLLSITDPRDLSTIWPRIAAALS